ncbi:hypothetical protein HDU98_006783 [Podochytrium sp. JEL0797]|nr:hypothetical protein HDU98_006783 [Podochytrium sp. JEL0797]
MPAQLAFTLRERITTWSGLLTNQPMRVYTPPGLSQLVQIVHASLEDNIPVKAIGSGLSFSDVAMTPGFLVKPDCLQRFLAIDADSLQPGINVEHLIAFESGVTIHNLNVELDKRGRALPNMGGYDLQTFVGACQTGTHGTGLSFPPICDFIVRITLVAADGSIHVIEPTDGITDPSKFTSPDGATLTQRDTLFYSVACGLGCFGLIHSIVIKTVPAFLLEERVELSTWQQVKSQLSALVKANTHADLLVNPYPDEKGNYACVVTRRNPGTKATPLVKKGHRSFVVSVVSNLPFVPKVLFTLFDKAFCMTPELIQSALSDLETQDGFTDKSHEVLVTGTSDKLKGTSVELFFDYRSETRDEEFAKAFDRILEMVQENKKYEWFLTSPIAVRFTAPSKCFMSSTHNRASVVVEILSLVGTDGFEEMAQRFEEEMTKPAFGARPHLGQLNKTVVASTVRNLFPGFEVWNRERAGLDPKGVFENNFLKKLLVG